MARMNSRHEVFAREYVKDLNGTRAAIAAGYAKKSAHVAASQLLRNPKVQAMVSSLTKKQVDKLDLDAEKVLAELSKRAFSNFLDYVRITEDGNVLVDLSKVTRDQGVAIQELTVDEHIEGKGKSARRVKRTKFKLADKDRSLELLGKNLKLFTERVEVNALEGLPEQVAAARKRANMRGRNG